MTQEEYYGAFFRELVQGKEYLEQLVQQYPVQETEDGIQPIIYIKSRIKTPESAMKKLEKKGLETDGATAVSGICDTIGIRIICSFEEEVYKIARWICKREDLCILEEKDYIAYPKPNGYRSFHLIVRFTQDKMQGLTAEIQICTIAIDFWAVLEHQLKYKQNIFHEDIIKQELKRCADEIASVDLSMQTIRELLRDGDWSK